KRVVAVSALHALAVAASREEPAGRIIGAWMDAHRRDVFSALFQTTSQSPFEPAGLVEIDAPAVGDPAATLKRWESAGRTPDVIAGDGAIVYASAIPPQISTLEQLPLATVIARMAAARARVGDTVDPAGIQPLYIRRPDAEIARDAQHGTSVEAEQGKPKP